jgi:hypothetical protein
MIFGIIGVFAGVVCYARKSGVSKLAVFLSFPFGADLYSYAGYFLPDSGKDKTLAIKYKWYGRFLNYMLNEKYGQLILAAIALLLVALSWSPWNLMMAAIFGGLYFWRGKHWMMQNIKMLSWVAVLLNLSACATIAYTFDKLFPILMIA